MGSAPSCLLNFDFASMYLGFVHFSDRVIRIIRILKSDKPEAPRLLCKRISNNPHVPNRSEFSKHFPQVAFLCLSGKGRNVQIISCVKATRIGVGVLRRRVADSTSGWSSAPGRPALVPAVLLVSVRIARVRPPSFSAVSI